LPSYFGEIYEIKEGGAGTQIEEEYGWDYFEKQ
jgi:hypothetical protein